MNIYLTIITTVLVLTQVIRITQNHIQLRRQNKLFKAQLGQIDDVTQDDLERQKAVYRMLYEELTERRYGKITERRKNVCEKMEAKHP